MVVGRWRQCDAERDINCADRVSGTDTDCKQIVLDIDCKQTVPAPRVTGCAGQHTGGGTISARMPTHGLLFAQ
jgi:hypothetical protein